MRHIAHHRYYMCVGSSTEDVVAPNNPSRHARFEVIDLDDVSFHVESFRRQLPRVDASYSVDRTTADASLISSLEGSGCALNLSSIDAVRLAADRNVNLADCCYSSPAKTRMNIMEAISLGVKRMTVAFPCEVMKISSVSKSVELVMLVSSTDEAAPRRCNGAPRRMWRNILETANARGMKIVGIAVQKTADGGSPEQKLCETLARVRDAYEMASECVHDIAFVDFGSTIADFCQHYQPAGLERCSTIDEESDDNDDGDDRSDTGAAEPERHEIAKARLDYFARARARARAELDSHFPKKLDVILFAQPAQYFIADEEVLKKWWGMPKTRRPAPCLHTYLMGGCTGNTAYISAYRSKIRHASDAIANEMEPAAPQA